MTDYEPDVDTMQLMDAIIEDTVTATCGHSVECIEVCADCALCYECCECRRPSDFTKNPMDSVARKSEAETVARNIMVILKRTGNEWRRLGWEEYKTERLEDGGFSESEWGYFDEVVGYCISPETAVLFSPVWAEAGGRGDD